MSIGLNKYLHGTLWGWVNGELVLIISSDEHNSQSPEVNCISVTGILGEKISINNFRYSHIQTVKKTQLISFEGAVPGPVLSAVKAKIRALFNLGGNIENLQGIKESAVKLIGELAKIEQPNLIEYEPEGDAPQDATPKPVAVNKQKKSTKKPRGGKSQKSEISKRTGKPKREMRAYTDEDETFVLDEEHTTEEIMERFGYTEKRKAADLKFMLKKRREKRQVQASQ